MGNIEKNGIVGVDNLFNIDNPMEESYNREDDLFTVGKKNVDVPVVEKEEDDTPKVDDDKDSNIDVPVIADDIIKSFDYRSIVNTLGDKGIIDFTNSVFTNEEGEELTIDNIDLSDENHFCDFIATIMNSQKEELMENKIDVNSVSDLTKKLIEAEKSGANILDILKEYDKTSAPIEKWDIDNKSDQLKIIRHYVNLLDLPKDDADEYYNGIISKGDDFVEARALKYKSELKKRMDDIIENRKVEAEKRRTKDLEDLKSLKKQFKSSLSQKYQLNESMLNKALNLRFTTSEDKPGVPLILEKAQQILMNPEEAPDLIMFLMNPDEFVKQKSSQKIKDEKIKTYKMVTNTNKNRSTAPIDDRGNEKKGIKIDEIKLLKDF